MDDLCTACLCSGRNLYFIGETGLHYLYSQILNEIQIYDTLCVRVCWECRALLARFQWFKAQVQKSYGLLMRADTPKHALYKPPRLAVQTLPPTAYPQIEIKSEFQFELDLVSVDRIKTEVEIEHSENTFVNGLEIEEKEKVKRITKKKRAKKKNKSDKKKKVKVIEDENLSDGFSEREPLAEDTAQDDVLDKVQDGVIDKAQDDVVDNVRGGLLEAKAEETSYMCAQCGLPFEDKGVFDAHVRTEHVKVVVVSKGAPVLPRTRSKEVLAEKPQCTECGKVFSSRKTYRYHLNVLHKGQNRYPCPRCGKVYQWKSNLGRHLRTHKARDDGELYCALCDKRFASVATYRQHLRVSRRHVSESEFSFVCNDCGKKFVNKTRLRDHVDWEHLKKIKFKCQLCNKPFKCHTSLYVHMQNVHRNKEKKDNLCHVCGKSYQNAAKLKYHIVAMHTSETPYQCGQCAAAFGWYSSLYRHIREVHYKMKVQPKKCKKGKKSPTDSPPAPLAMPQPGPP